MVITLVPQSSAGIKSVQRGQAASSGNITITAVDTSKTFVRSFSEGADGTISSTSTITGTLTPSGGDTAGGGTGRYTGGPVNLPGSSTSYTGTRTISGGSTTATVKAMGVYLSNSTTLVATGACRWEVVEFN